MNDQTKAAFASASDTSKQLITLATGLLALEITFLKDVMEAPEISDKILIGLSWISLLLSVAAGVCTLLALTGSLGAEKTLTPRSISDSNVRYPAIAQILLFLAGLVLTVVFGFRGMGS